MMLSVAPNSERTNARLGALKAGVNVDCAGSALALSATHAPIATNVLRTMVSGSRRVLGNNANGITDDLKETTPHSKLVSRFPNPNGEFAVAEKRHERCMSGKDPHLPVVRRRPDGVGDALENRSFRRNNGDLHHADSSFFAFSTASPMPPTM
jgi:hypothetical protein